MADVNIAVAVATRKAVAELNKLEQEFKDLGAQAEKSGEQTSSGFSIMSKGAAGAAIAIAAIGTASVAAINQASKFQDLETQFIAFTGSAEAAAEQVERIAEFSGQTPFQVDELAQANKTLLAFGSSTEESFVQLKQLGEVAAATGSSIGDLSQIFGQIQVAGKLTGERFNQLAERSVNLGPTLAKSLGVAETEIRGLISAGKITADEVSKAFETMTTGSGQFAGGMERLSKTFTGAQSTLSDNVSLLAADIGKKLLPAATGITIAFTDAVKWIREFTKETKADKISSFNGEIALTEKTIENLNEQIKAAGEGGLLFQLFAGDPTEETKRLNAELLQTEKKLADLKKARDATLKAETNEDGTIKEKIPEAVEPAGTGAEVSATEKINQELEILNQQKIANAKAAGDTKNAILLEQLDIERENLLLKEEEKNIALLESQGLYEEAQLIRAELQAEKLNEIKKKEEADRKAIIAKAKADEFNFQRKDDEAKRKWEEQNWQQRAQTTQAGLAALASLQYSGSKQAFEIGKAASIAQALVSIPSTAIKAYESLAGIPVVGPALGAAAAAAAVVAGTARVNQIRATKFQAFAQGGLVEGGIKGVDSVPALLTPGEVVVPQKNFKDIQNDMGGGSEYLRLSYNRLGEMIDILESIEGSSSNNVIETQKVGRNIGNISLPNHNKPGDGNDYTDINVETFEEWLIYRREQREREAAAKAEREGVANTTPISTTPGRSEITTNINSEAEQYV